MGSRDPGHPIQRGTKGDPPHGRRTEDGLLVRLAPVVMAAALCMMVVAVVLSVAGLRSVSRINSAEKKACLSARLLQREVNAQGRIIFIALDTIRIGSEKTGNGRASAYGKLADQVSFQPAINCKTQVDNPNSYVLPTPIPFKDLTPRPALTP